jgi:hypothetical protein
VDTRSLVIVVLCGIAVTILTGLIYLAPPILLGASHYGYPFAWLTRLIIAPEYFPWRVDIVSLVVDVVVWTILIGVALFVWAKIKSS